MTGKSGADLTWDASAPQCHSIDRIPTCPVRAQDQERSRERQVLFEVEQLVTIAELVVDDNCPRGTKCRKHEGRDPRLPAQQDENPSAQLDRDNQWQDLSRKPE